MTTVPSTGGKKKVSPGQYDDYDRDIVTNYATELFFEI